jgi:uroporphyrinogen decarboxylase
VHERALKMGIKLFSTHICGEQNLNLKCWQEVPMGEPGIMTFGHEVDLNKAKEMFGEKCIIGGNVNPTKIQFGTGREVYNLCKEAIEKGKESAKGYVLMPGCELPPEAPPYNVYMMRKAVEDFGYY